MIQPATNYNNYRPRRVKVKAIYGPIEVNFDRENSADVVNKIKLVECSGKFLAYVETEIRQQDGSTKVEVAIFTWTLDEVVHEKADGASIQTMLQPIKQKIPIEPQIKEQASKKLEPIKIYPRFVDIKTTQSQAIFLSEARTVYSTIFTKLKDTQLECVPIKKLTNITKIESSFTHFLALQKEELPPIREWTPHQVADFVTRIGFKEAASIAIYSKITGD